jgi:hypothetical protein
MDGSFIWYARTAARRLRLGGALAAGVALAVLATGGVALASDAAAPGTVAAAKEVRACYHPSGTQPAVLSVLIGRHAKCLPADKHLTWNIVGPQGPAGPQGQTGPQGPAGLGTGVTTGSSTASSVPIDGGPGDQITVMTAPAVPTSGIYYVTASVTVEVASGDFVACAPVPNGIEFNNVQFGPAPANVSTSLVVASALNLTAGQAPGIICIDETANQGTSFVEGGLTATLIDSSTGPASPNRTPAGRFPLRIVTSAK